MGWAVIKPGSKLARFLGRSLAQPAVQCSPSADGHSARDQFLGVCADTRKAWTQANLFSLVRIEKVRASRGWLCTGSAAEIAEHMIEVAGPVLVRLGREHWGGSPALAQPVLESLLAADVLRRDPGNMLSMERLKQVCLHWIECGELLGHDETCGPSDARSISEFMLADLKDDTTAVPELLRLALLAPVIAVMETLSIFAELSPSLLDVMAASNQQAGGAHG